MPNNIRRLPSTRQVQAWRALLLALARKTFSTAFSFLIVQRTPKLSFLDCCNDVYRRAYACGSFVNTQVTVSPLCSDPKAGNLKL
jgi:hypothetical protein